MWKRLPEAEIVELNAREKARRERLGPPLATAVVLASLLMILWGLGYRGGRVASGIVLLGPAVSLLSPRQAAVFGVATLLIFRFVRRRYRAGHSLLGLGEGPSVICTACQHIAAAHEADRCECGGAFEPAEFWTWEAGAQSPPSQVA